MTSYRIEFGPAWPVPPITVDFTDRTAATRAVAEHAIPHLTPKLTEMGRPEFADCFFRTNGELTVGEFMWLDLAAGRGARFCPARLTPLDSIDDDICGDQFDDVCVDEPGHDGDHMNEYATASWADTPTV